MARTPGGVAPPVGATVGLTWNPSAAHVFDMATGERVSITTGYGIPLPVSHTDIKKGSICA